jgi:hypothetical protein
MHCNRRRWANHALSAPSKVPESGAAKEMNERLAQMQQERMRQDAMWEEPQAALVVQQQQIQNSSTNK